MKEGEIETETETQKQADKNRATQNVGEKGRDSVSERKIERGRQNRYTESRKRQGYSITGVRERDRGRGRETWEGEIVCVREKGRERKTK